MPDVFKMPIPQEPKRLAIVFCSHDRVHAGWAYDYGHLIGKFISTGGHVPETGENYALSLNWCQTSLLPEGRYRLVEDLQKKGVQKILWVDTDMRFPKEGAHMLLRHNQPIVGVNYVSRRPPFRFTAATLENQALVTRPKDTGLVEVAHLGFGFLLTDIAVFDAGKPMFGFNWYRDETDNDKWKIIGEDVQFCREARARGFKVFVDQELSAIIGHIGEFEYNAEVMQQIETAQVG